jgi:TRAP-type C4-dicarboxylate transport system permease small subunit
VKHLPVAVLTGLGIAALLTMVIATLLAIATRFLGITGLEWSYEVAGIAFVWTTFLGAALAEVRCENAAFEVVRVAAPPPLRRAMERLSALLLLVVGAVLLSSGIAEIQRSGWVPTPLLRWPEWVQSAAAPVLGASLCLLAVSRLSGGNVTRAPDSPATVAEQAAGTPL